MIPDDSRIRTFIAEVLSKYFIVHHTSSSCALKLIDQNQSFSWKLAFMATIVLANNSQIDIEEKLALIDQGSGCKS